MTTFSPWSTPEDDRRFRALLRRQRRELRATNPKLARRLRKMSDADLEDVERGLLELMPFTPSTEYALRNLKAIAYWRDHPRKPIEPERSEPIEPRGLAEPAGVISGGQVGSVTPDPETTLHPTAKADISPPLETESPDNVVEPDLTNVVPLRPTVYGVPVQPPASTGFHGKCFHAGKEL
jgi:hypothetical protein